MTSATAENPYRAPGAAVVDLATMAVPIECASKWRRFFNCAIDAAVLYGLTVGVLVAAVVAGDERWIDAYEGLRYWQRFLVDGAICIAYYWTFEAVFGVTVGKLLTGTHVVDAFGHPPSGRQVLVRSVCRFIPFEALSLAFSEDGRARGWHDSLARTYVARRRAPGA